MSRYTYARKSIDLDDSFDPFARPGKGYLITLSTEYRTWNVSYPHDQPLVRCLG